MLSYDDFSEKQLVVISADEYKNLSLQAWNLIIKQEDVVKQKFSCSKIFSLYIIGDCTITTKLIDELLGYWISVYFLWAHLKPKFIVGNQLEGNYLLRNKQYQAVNDLDIAKRIIEQKVANQIALLKELRSKSEDSKRAIKLAQAILIKINTIESSDSLRWLEWTVSKLFFSQYFAEQWRYKRLPRTKVDVINFLLDMWYSFLYSFLEANLQLYGFDTYKWVYHTLFFERKSLVCDLVEPFRCIIDRALRKAYNLWQINEKDFQFKQGQYQIDWSKRQDYIKIFFMAILEQKQDIFQYVKWYYRYTMNNENQFPDFKI